MPNPELEPVPNTLFAIVVRPKVEELACEAHTPGPPLLLMSTGPAQASTLTNELSPIRIPPLTLLSKAPLAPTVTSDIPPAFKPTPAFPLLAQTSSAILLLLKTEMPSPAGLVTLSP